MSWTSAIWSLVFLSSDLPDPILMHVQITHGWISLNHGIYFLRKSIWKSWISYISYIRKYHSWLNQISGNPFGSNWSQCSALTILLCLGLMNSWCCHKTPLLRVKSAWNQMYDWQNPRWLMNQLLRVDQSINSRCWSNPISSFDQIR